MEPGTLERFIFEDFVAAWDAMAASRRLDVGGNFMFARQAFGYLELASRTASTDENGWYLGHFAQRLASLDRYFTELPGPVPVSRQDDLRLPALSDVPADRQLLAALFDTARHGLSHLGQQTPVHLTDNKIWMLSFTGVRTGEHFEEQPTTQRRDRHLAFTVSPHGHVYLLLRPDVFIADLRWSARLAAIFSQYLVPEYLVRPKPRRPRTSPPAPSRRAEPTYQFSSTELIQALRRSGHGEYEWPRTAG